MTAYLSLKKGTFYSLSWVLTLIGWVNWISLVYFQRRLYYKFNCTAFSSVSLRSHATFVNTRDKREPFAAFCDSSDDTERPLGHSAEKSEEMNLKGSRASIKPLRWNIICQDRSLLCHSLFFLPFLPFSLRGCVPLKFECQWDRKHALPKCSLISSSRLVPQSRHSIRCVRRRIEEHVHAFVWHCTMCPNLFAVMCSSLICLLYTLAVGWQPLPPWPLLTLQT